MVRADRPDGQWNLWVDPISSDSRVAITAISLPPTSPTSLVSPVTKSPRIFLPDSTRLLSGSRLWKVCRLNSRPVLVNSFVPMVALIHIRILSLMIFLIGLLLKIGSCGIWKLFKSYHHHQPHKNNSSTDHFVHTDSCPLPRYLFSIGSFLLL